MYGEFSEKSAVEDKALDLWLGGVHLPAPVGQLHHTGLGGLGAVPGTAAVHHRLPP